MLTEDVFTHTSIEQASSHRATIEAEHRPCIEPASSLHRATASSQHRAFSIEHRGRGSGPDGPPLLVKSDLAVWRHPARAVCQIPMTKFSCFALAAADMKPVQQVKSRSVCV
jgi:hypothetical protein